MKLVRTFSLVLALAGASTVYADPPKAPPAKAAPDKAAPAPDKAAPPAKSGKPEMNAAEVAKLEKFTTDFSDAIVKNKAACPKMGASINSVIDKHEAWLKTAMQKEPPQSYKDKTKAREAEMKTAVEACMQDKDVQAAVQRFFAIATAAAKADKGAPTTPPPPPAKK